MADDFLTLREAADLVACSERTLLRWLSKGHLSRHSRDGQRVVLRSELLRAASHVHQGVKTNFDVEWVGPTSYEGKKKWRNVSSEFEFEDWQLEVARRVLENVKS